ncbi:MAG: MFS transporter [Candidatus Accumulibacter sp.]|jgi:predicted MFS family arabinose efflux permease|uniref:MFS transporter n=1 Tax=Accumulibacter sp. TaxID=2053492 RepID=UPI001AC680A9|nr:MFS transporter [Accumulibacter sp.]MBN8439162.1 MFS transporter [Accumulibacter sp.]
MKQPATSRRIRPVAAVPTPADSAVARQPHVAWRRLALYLVAAQCLALLLLACMLLNKHHRLLDELTLSRIEIQASELEAALRTGVTSGLRPDEILRLQAMVEQLKDAEPAIAAIDVLCAEAPSARIVFADDRTRVGRMLPADVWQRLSSAQGFTHAQSDAGPQIAVAVRDMSGSTVGGLRVSADAVLLAAAGEAVTTALWSRVGAAIGATTVVTLVVLAWLRSRGGDAALRRRILLLALSTTLAASAVVALQADALFAERLRPALTAKVQGVTRLLASKLEHAAALGIPLDQLPALGDYFAAIIARHPEVAALRLRDASGRVLAEYGTARSGWIEHAAGDARVAAATDERFVAHRLGELAVDVGIVLVVAALLFRELLAALLGALPRADGTSVLNVLQSARLPLFLFILSEEVSRAFLPLYVQSFATGNGWLGEEAAIGLPITLYMLCFALATPFAGRWADRQGVARVFSAGVGLALVGFAWTALATTYWQLLPARALCACGYAAGTMACQRQLISLTRPAERARALALFVGVVGIAAICGSALGGVLADQFGFRPVFALAALLTVLALGVFHGTPGWTTGTRAAGPLLGLAEIGRLFGNRRFALLVLGSAIPAKIALAGFLFYLVPLALHQLAYDPAAIGRAVMLYFVLVAAVNLIASRLSDRYSLRLSLTLIGGLVTSLGGLLAMPGGLGVEEALWAGITALGIGTGLAAAPTQALASEIGADAGATSVAVVLRSSERLGSVVGPLWAGVWLAAAGCRGAMLAIGATVLAGTMLCVFIRRARVQ